MEVKATRVEVIQKYYNESARHEWSRHERHRFEFPVTMHYLKRHLKDSSRILDIGGGPGRYSIELAKDGHDVSLFDLAEENIKLAKEKALEQNVKLNNFHVGDARDLSCFEEETFDAVLVFGPLYHLSSESERKMVIHEALRILKPGGLIAVSFISHYAPLNDVVRRYPLTLKEQKDKLLGFLDHGMHISSENEPGFIDAFFCDPSKIQPFFDSFGIEKLSFFGAESFIAQSEGKLIDLGEDILHEWIDFACLTAETPGAIFNSDHIVYIGKK